MVIVSYEAAFNYCSVKADRMCDGFSVLDVAACGIGRLMREDERKPRRDLSRDARV